MSITTIQGVLPMIWRTLGLCLLAGTAFGADDPRPKAKAQASYVETIDDAKVKFDMVAIPGGTFWMGSKLDEPGGRNDEGPRHKVGLRPFWIGKHEVTWAEYHAYMREQQFAFSDKPVRPATTPKQKAADAVSKPTRPYIDETYGYGSEKYPAFDMSHHAAMKYCEWLSAKTGRTYRLPTEAEWEYAARAGTDTAYHFGNDAKQLRDYGWVRGTSGTAEFKKGKTHPVGQKKPNPWGLHDMYGNVMEWCLDEYDPMFYRTFKTTPLGPARLPGKKHYPHVVRGGCFKSEAVDCRSAARTASDKRWNRGDPNEPQSIWWLSTGVMVGFRVVRPVDEYPALRGLTSQVTETSNE